MIFYILLALMVLAITFLTEKAPKCERWIVLPTTSILLLVIFTFGVCQQGPWEETGRTDYKQSLFSLKVENVISGKFNLGTGYYRGRAEYFYCTKDSDGFYQMNSNPIRDSRIKEIPPSQQPFLSYQIIHKKVPSKFVPFNITKTEQTMIDFYIPENSTIVNFDPN